MYRDMDWNGMERNTMEIVVDFKILPWHSVGGRKSQNSWRPAEVHRNQTCYNKKGEDSYKLFVIQVHVVFDVRDI
jgi:hypothetical protein